MAAQRPKLDDTVVIRGLVSKAIVAHSGGTESPSEIDPSRGQRSPFLYLCATFVLFVYACCVCLWKFSRLRPFPNPAISSLALQETETELGDHADAPVLPLLCPCGGINSRIEEAITNRKVLEERF